NNFAFASRGVDIAYLGNGRRQPQQAKEFRPPLVDRQLVAGRARWQRALNLPDRLVDELTNSGRGDRRLFLLEPDQRRSLLLVCEKQLQEGAEQQRATHQQDEYARIFAEESAVEFAPDRLLGFADHSTTQVAWINISRGMVSPRAVARRELMTKSNCSG